MTDCTESVTSANIGAEQVPVKREDPAKAAVTIPVFVYAIGVVPASPLIVVASMLVLDVVLVVLCLLAPPVVKLKGEHPTKFGAVELTAAHSCILNCIAA